MSHKKTSNKVIHHPASLLKKLYDAQADLCAYCGDEMSVNTKNTPKSATLDHVAPKSRGGLKDEFNCVASCYQCNQEKKNNPLHVFLTFKTLENKGKFPDMAS